MPRDAYRKLVEVARQRYGVTTDLEAAQCGLSESQITRMLTSGVFIRPEAGVLIIGAAPAIWEQDVAVAVLSMGPEAVASHMTAAAMWGMLNTSGERVEVSVPRWERTHRTHIVHESLDLDPRDRTVLGGIPITTPARTVTDLGAVFPSAVLEAFDRGRRAGIVEIGDLAEVVERVARKGRRGVGPSREVIRFRRRWTDQTESRAEDMYLEISRRADLPEPVQQYEIRDEGGWFICRADFAYPPPKLAIFIDGFAYHSDDESFQKDRSQQNLLELIGWRYLRFTYDDLVNHQVKVVHQVRRALPSVLA